MQAIGQRRWAWLAVILAIGLTAAACGGDDDDEGSSGSESGGDLSGEINVSGSSTVEPISVTWTTGDGSQVSCSGPGTAWAPRLPEDATDCSHTYTTASDTGDGGRFDLSVAVELNVTWSSNAGPGGTLPTLTRTGDRSVRVGEVQALETG